MAEIWYISIDAETFEDSSPQHEIGFYDCVELLEITPDNWLAELDAMPELKTGDPLVDESGYVCVLMRAPESEIEGLDTEDWKPGWYKSRLTVVGFETKLRTKPK